MATLFGKPKHGEPQLIRINITSDEINKVLAKMHILGAAYAMGLATMQQLQLRLNGQPCGLHRASLNDWHLLETIGGASKTFYLVPSSGAALAQLDNRVPHVVCDPAEDFSQRYSTDAGIREVQAHMLPTLNAAIPLA